MSRRSWIQIDGKLYEKGVDELPPEMPRQGAPRVCGDLPDFVSPIDGKTYSGRAGMREHCARHDVIPTADLKGLPFRTMNREHSPDRAGTREEIRRQLYK